MVISRQAAIDALRMDISIIPFAKAREYVREAIETIYNRLEKLPSAQQEIIHCEDCKHYNAGFECLIEGYGIERNKDWYCGDAERRTDG